MAKKKGNYTKIIEKVFRSKYKAGADSIAFERDDIINAAKKLKLPRPKNVGDVVYSFRYRNDFPSYIVNRATRGKDWMIVPAGQAKYSFVLSKLTVIRPTSGLAETMVPDATPGIANLYALTDEQALLAKLRYNRLIDVFTGVTCYSMQNHLRTQVEDMGQIETDELYVGIDKRGAHYVIPVQAKSGNDRLHVVQVLQDMAMCAEKFPGLICRSIASQFVEPNLIAMFEFEKSRKTAAIVRERHYRLVPSQDTTPEEYESYRDRPED